MVIDESAKGGGSGSSVGKTTLLRAINYVLGGTAKLMYMDREFKTENKLIRDFILDERTRFRLTLRSLCGDTLTLERNESPKDKRAKRGFVFNGHRLKNLKEYNANLASAFFRLSAEDKPTYRQLITKFVRTEPEHMENVLRYLHGSATDNEYLATHSALFGFRQRSLFSEHQALVNDIKNAYSEIARLHSESTDRTRERITLLNNEIARVSMDIESGTDLPNSADIWPTVSTNRDRLTALSARVAQLHIRDRNTREAIGQLEAHSGALATTDLRNLYDSAFSALGTLAHDFNDLVNFHRRLLGTRREFFLRIIKRARHELESLNGEISSIEREQRELLSLLEQRGAYGSLVDRINHLSNLRVQLARLEAQLEALTSAEDRLSRLREDLEKVEAEVRRDWSTVESFVREFNGHLEALSRSILGSPVRLTAILGSRSPTRRSPGELRATFEPVELESNVGTGKKRAFVGCFDIAYTRALASHNTGIMSSYPRFSLLDLVENIAPSELGPLLRAAEETANGQFVVAALRERLEGTIEDELLHRATILRLSENDRFFRL